MAAQERKAQFIPSVTLPHARGVIVGHHARQTNWFLARINLPRSVEIALLLLIVLAMVAVGGWAVITKVLPRFAPLYRTVFVIDSSLASSPQANEDVISSLNSAVANSGDRDALALRGFGGNCGDSGNTRRLIDFTTENRGDIAQIASAVELSGAATLQRGIVGAIEDLSQPWTVAPQLGNRIIVVTRNAIDACDPDSAFVSEDLKKRIGAADIDISFRIVGYQIDRGQRTGLNKTFEGVGDTPPVYADTSAELDEMLYWYTNVEPLVRSANDIADILNPTAAEVEFAAQSIRGGRLDNAEVSLDAAAEELQRTKLTFEDLRSRTSTTEGQRIGALAGRLRQQQEKLVSSVRTLRRLAAREQPLSRAFEDFQKAAVEYNSDADDLNSEVRTLRAQAPESTS
ncbi:hypothetical protein [Kineosporia babensis]|uniref:VWA domain-containing protein n=1 Tax=Kineosporia babensis TaxID=499548 RepID=A0A9X1N9U6_9ACTN|nr:hypothetical protein [Kineosporia babensis]MCD5311032.1 hypothetical protein [Kineosporia babensis]